MGMFDTVYVNCDLPFEIGEKKDYPIQSQTKQLDCCLDEFFIDKEGYFYQLELLDFTFINTDHLNTKRIKHFFKDFSEIIGIREQVALKGHDQNFSKWDCGFEFLISKGSVKRIGIDICVLPEKIDTGDYSVITNEDYKGLGLEYEYTTQHIKNKDFQKRIPEHNEFPVLVRDCFCYGGWKTINDSEEFQENYPCYFNLSEDFKKNNEHLLPFWKSVGELIG